MYVRFVGGAALICSLLLTPACGRKGVTTPGRTYRLADHDALILHLPAGWMDEVRPLPGEPFPSIFLAPEGGDVGGVVLTAIGRSGPGSPGPTEEQLQRAVEEAAAEMGRPTVVEVYGDSSRGWIATETADGRPRDSQGICLVGELILTVEVQGGEAMRDHAVALLETAEHQRS